MKQMAWHERVPQSLNLMGKSVQIVSLNKNDDDQKQIANVIICDPAYIREEKKKKKQPNI